MSWNQININQPYQYFATIHATGFANLFAAVFDFEAPRDLGFGPHVPLINQWWFWILTYHFFAFLVILWFCLVSMSRSRSNGERGPSSRPVLLRRECESADGLVAGATGEAVELSGQSLLRPEKGWKRCLWLCQCWSFDFGMSSWSWSGEGQKSQYTMKMYETSLKHVKIRMNKYK